MANNEDKKQSAHVHTKHMYIAAPLAILAKVA